VIKSAPSGGAAPTLGVGNGISNYSAQNSRKLLAARARVASNSGLARLAFLGDSNFAGAWSTGNALLANAKSGAPSARIASTLIASNGITAIDDSWFGDAHLTTQAGYNAYNTKVVMGGSWNPSGGNRPGGAGMLANTNASNLAFTPTSAFDTIDIYTIASTAGGSFTVNVDGGATLATLSTAGTNGVYTKQTVTGVTLGVHTINCTTTSTSNTWIAGIAVHKSAAAVLEMYNMGINSATAATYNVANIAADLAVIAPHCTFINLTTNDINTVPTSIPVFTTNSQALITAALATGDCIIMVGVPANATNWGNGVNLTYISAIYALAAANNIPLLDFQARWTSYAITNANMPYGDTLHPGPAGYADMALPMAAFLQ
jgi:lysophospholipase L1-like esterase